MNKWLKDEFEKLGYNYFKETDSYIEIRTCQYGAFTRIKLYKLKKEVCKDSRSSQGNKGWRNLSKDEIDIIHKYFKEE